MMTPTDSVWLDAMQDIIASYKRVIDAATVQLSDDELFLRPASGVNSVAIILRHLGGNLQSRWTDFLTTDGEKPDRDRDTEFIDWNGDRESLMEYFNCGWNALNAAFDKIDDNSIGKKIKIRGETHTIHQAMTRSVTHITYHAGQIVMVARMVHEGEWRWLTISPGNSSEFNKKNWGSSASRSIFSNDGIK